MPPTGYRCDGGCYKPVVAIHKPRCIQENVLIDGLMKCPCSKCENIPYQSVDTIKLHLYKNGFQPDYYRWTCHGEDYFQNITFSSRFTTTPEESNPYKDMADFENKKAANFESEDKRSEDELLLEALGGWKQGRIYSLGLAATIFFDKSQKDNNAKKARIDHVNQLESHVEQLNSENVQLRKELDAANEKLDATT
uniref:Transposase-associated domain-containing protein n=1 Tax=Chenopodium quinoa TaxID=63459 RepID=A0A803MTA8_CHEQI